MKLMSSRAAAAVAFLILMTPMIALAQSPERPAPPERPASPMAREIFDLLADARAELGVLEADYMAASGAERDALEKRIAALKIGMEISVLETQLRFARDDGRDDDARRLEQAIASLRQAPQLDAPPRSRAEPGARR